MRAKDEAEALSPQAPLADVSAYLRTYKARALKGAAGALEEAVGASRCQCLFKDV